MLWSSQYRHRYGLLEVLERRFTCLIPFERFNFLQEHVEWLGSFGFGWKRDNEVSRPFNRWNSLTLVGLCILIIATHFSGFPSIPLYVIMIPKKFPHPTPKVHFLGFKHMLYFRTCANSSLESTACWAMLYNLLTISST